MPTVSQSQPSVALFNQETLQQRLQALIEGARKSWTYAIFWQSSYDYSNGVSILGWGDGYYKGEDDKSKSKAKNKASSSVELGSTEVIFQSSDLMNKVRVLFNFNFFFLMAGFQFLVQIFWVLNFVFMFNLMWVWS